MSPLFAARNVRRLCLDLRPRWRRTLLASAAALSLGFQDAAWATCTNGQDVPFGGFIVGLPPVPTAANWSPHVFTGTTGSFFIPDSSVHEHNNTAEALTGGGHNWVFDQGSTLCKVTDIGPTRGVATEWAIPPATPSVCIILPVIRNGVVTNLGDIPFQGDAITPTCNPDLLSTATAPNPNNTYFNQLGCSISHGVATTPQTATSWLFVTGVQSGLFSVPLDNVTNPINGGEAGKTVSGQNYYAAIPEGSLLTNAAVSKDGQFLIATSSKRLQAVWACFNPLGDPGDPNLPIDPNFFVPPTNSVSCMQVGTNNMAADLTTAFGPDNQPYFGGRRVVMSFDSQPGGRFASAWPNCIWQGNGAASLADAFNNPLAFSNGCGPAQANFAFDAALVIQPNALISHGSYMYGAPNGGTIQQFYVTQDPISHITQYQFRQLVTGLPVVTGLGVAEDQQSLMIYSDPSGIGLSGQEFVTRLPLCEDMGPQPPTPTQAPPKVVANNPPAPSTPKPTAQPTPPGVAAQNVPAAVGGNVNSNSGYAIIAPRAASSVSQPSGAGRVQPPQQQPTAAPQPGTMAAALAQGDALNRNAFGGDPAKSALATGMGFASFNDPRLVADRLATAAQQGVPGASDAFQKMMAGSSAGGGCSSGCVGGQ